MIMDDIISFLGKIIMATILIIFSIFPIIMMIFIGIEQIQKISLLIYFHFTLYHNKMEDQAQQTSSQKPQLMEEQYPNTTKDIFEQFLVESIHDRSMQIEKTQKPYHYRSSKNLLRRSDFIRKILNSSSSNQKLIPSSIKYDSSRQNSYHEGDKIEKENSANSEEFQKSFKKKFQQSFSVQNTIRDSSSQFSQKSDSKGSHNIIIPIVCKQEDIITEERKVGCNCKRSKCLKLYCECFQKQHFCSNQCNCQGCGNHKDNEEEHKQAVIFALSRNAHGFQEEQRQNAPETKIFSLGVQPNQVRKGCKCKKTKCLKKYCQCYQSGISCTIFCRCEDCSNDKINPKPQNPNSIIQTQQNEI